MMSAWRRWIFVHLTNCLFVCVVGGFATNFSGEISWLADKFYIAIIDSYSHHVWAKSEVYPVGMGGGSPPTRTHVEYFSWEMRSLLAIRASYPRISYRCLTCIRVRTRASYDLLEAQTLWSFHRIWTQIAAKYPRIKTSRDVQLHNGNWHLNNKYLRSKPVHETNIWGKHQHTLPNKQANYQQTLKNYQNTTEAPPCTALYVYAIWYYTAQHFSYISKRY